MESISDEKYRYLSIWFKLVTWTLHNLLVSITRAICTCLSDKWHLFWVVSHFSSCDLFVAILLVMLLIVPYIFPKRETAFLLSGGWLFLLTGRIQLGCHVQPNAFIDAVLVYLFRFDGGRLETDSVFFAGYTAYFRESLFHYLFVISNAVPRTSMSSVGHALNCSWAYGNAPPFR